MRLFVLILLVAVGLYPNAVHAHDDKTLNATSRMFVTVETGVKWYDGVDWSGLGDFSGSAPLLNFKTEDTGILTRFSVVYKFNKDQTFIPPLLKDSGENLRIEVLSSIGEARMEQRLKTLAPPAGQTNFAPLIDGVQSITSADELDTIFSYHHEYWEIASILLSDHHMGNGLVISPFFGFEHVRLDQGYQISTTVDTIRALSFNEDIDTDYIGGLVGTKIQKELGGGFFIHVNGSTAFYHVDSTLHANQEFPLAGVRATLKDTDTDFAYRLRGSVGFGYEAKSVKVEVVGEVDFMSRSPGVTNPTLSLTPAELRWTNTTDRSVQVKITKYF